MPATGAFAVEAIRSEEDLDRLLRLGVRTFASDYDEEAVVAGWRDWIRGEPTYRPELVRGVYEGRELVGGCVLYDLDLRVPGSLLRTVGIGGVVTWPEHRLRGVGRALMEDCTRFAREGGYPLLLLSGIPGFYHRYGYIDVLDEGAFHIDTAAAAGLADPGLEVRVAGPGDVAALLALYRHGHDAYAGSFVRDETRQRLLLATRHRRYPPLLAVAGDGRPHGYAHIGGAPRWAHFCREAVALDWPAAAALLRAHAASVQGLPEPPGQLEWQVPQDSATAHLITDHLAARWSVRQAPNEGWMARLGEPRRLLQGLAPLWDRRWRERRPDWAGILGISVEGQTTRFAASATGLEPVREGACDLGIELPGGALCQLLFGFRPASYLAPRLSLDERWVPTLEALFPPVRAYIAGSDAF